MEEVFPTETPDPVLFPRGFWSCEHKWMGGREEEKNGHRISVQ